MRVRVTCLTHHVNAVMTAYSSILSQNRIACGDYSGVIEIYLVTLVTCCPLHVLRYCHILTNCSLKHEPALCRASSCGQDLNAALSLAVWCAATCCCLLNLVIVPHLS